MSGEITRKLTEYANISLNYDANGFNVPVEATQMVDNANNRGETVIRPYSIATVLPVCMSITMLDVQPVDTKLLLGVGSITYIISEVFSRCSFVTLAASFNPFQLALVQPRFTQTSTPNLQATKTDFKV